VEDHEIVPEGMKRILSGTTDWVNADEQAPVKRRVRNSVTHRLIDSSTHYLPREHTHDLTDSPFRLF